MTGLLAFGVYVYWPRSPSATPYAAPSYPEPSDPGHKRAFHEVCPLVNRPEVLALLENPPEVHGQGTSYDPEGMDYLSCSVGLVKRSVRLEVGHGLAVTAMTEAATGGHQLTVLGRPALYEQNRLVAPAAYLTVAWNPADPSAYASVVVIQPEGYADEALLVRLAEQILPRLTG